MWSLLVWISVSFCALVVFGQSQDSICVPIAIPVCQALPYNRAAVPRGRRSQFYVNRSLDTYRQLIDSSCSPDLLFLLCAYHLPMCQPAEFDVPIKPCRELCEKVKSECNATIQLANAYKEDWPQQIRCTDLPSYYSGVCTQPSSFVDQKSE